MDTLTFGAYRKAESIRYLRNLITFCKVGVETIEGRPAQFRNFGICFSAHNDKICCLRYNPVASDVLASAANDCTVIIWDMTSFTARFRLSGHEYPVSEKRF